MRSIFLAVTLCLTLSFGASLPVEAAAKVPPKTQKSTNKVVKTPPRPKSVPANFRPGSAALKSNQALKTRRASTRSLPNPQRSRQMSAGSDSLKYNSSAQLEKRRSQGNHQDSSLVSTHYQRRPSKAGSEQIVVPRKAVAVVDRVRATGEHPRGYKGGRKWVKRKNQNVPDGNYKEYDVDHRPKGKRKRNAERVVVNTDTGEAYYTNDHYKTFTKME